MGSHPDRVEQQSTTRTVNSHSILPAISSHPNTTSQPEESSQYYQLTRSFPKLPTFTILARPYIRDIMDRRSKFQYSPLFVYICFYTL